MRNVVVLALISSTVASSSIDPPKSCEKHDLMAVLGVAMMPAWPNCSQAMAASDENAPALDLAIASVSSLKIFCDAPACVQNLEALYTSLPNCVGPNGLNLQKLNLYTKDILCNTLPSAVLTQAPSEPCKEVDLAVLEFLWMFPPWKNCTSQLLEPPLAMLMTGNASQTAAFCAAPACVSYASSIVQRMPSCFNNSTLQVGWANVGSNSKTDLVAKLSSTCAVKFASVAVPLQVLSIPVLALAGTALTWLHLSS